MDNYDDVALAALDGARSDRQELAAFLEARLSHPLSDRKIDMLLDVQTGLRRRQSDLEQQLGERQISREEYLERLNASLRWSMDQNCNILGVADFGTVYGEAGASPESLIDQNIFLAADDAA